MKTVGLSANGFLNWAGGVDFLSGFAASLAAAAPQLELRLLLPAREVPPTLRDRAESVARRLIGRPNVVAQRRIAAGRIKEMVAALDVPVVIHETLPGAAAQAEAARQLGLEAVLPSFGALPPHFPVPWLGYLYDVQHRRMPHLFSRRELQMREEHFVSVLRAARAVIVNAHDVAADIARYYPGHHARIFVLPFYAAPQRVWLNHGPGNAAGRHAVSRPYFIICNQFWRHKDHTTAFAAFATFAEANRNVDLICTGATSDWRDRHYVPSLLRSLQTRGLGARVHVLGMIAKADQIELLRGALALVQPTLFEGGPGGGAVFDAVAVGVTCLVSDIPVNREIAGEAGLRYFPAGDAAALAKLMGEQAQSPAVLPDIAALISRGNVRRRACGDAILQALEFAAR